MNNYIVYFNELVKSGSFFWFCALAGSGMFSIQFIINIFGFSDTDSLLEASHDSLDAQNFKWLSIQTLTGFLMMFGWTGLTCQKEFGLADATTLGISCGVGLLTGLFIRTIFKLAKKLKSSGTVYRIEDAIGQEGYVYQSISKGGKGKIAITLHHLTYEIDAISYHHESLPSFVRIKVIDKSDANTVVVIPISR